MGVVGHSEFVVGSLTDSKNYCKRFIIGDVNQVSCFYSLMCIVKLLDLVLCSVIG